MTRSRKNGQNYYVFPDEAANKSGVRGRSETISSYQQSVRTCLQLANDNLQAAEMNEDAAMSWSTWWYGEPKAAWDGIRIVSAEVPPPPIVIVLVIVFFFPSLFPPAND